MRDGSIRGSTRCSPRRGAERESYRPARRSVCGSAPPPLSSRPAGRGTPARGEDEADGLRDEAAIYDNTFQPYGQIYVMNADGSGQRIVTDSLWEDSMPLYIPNAFL
jgi:hypothetical protein